MVDGQKVVQVFNERDAKDEFVEYNQKLRLLTEGGIYGSCLPWAAS